MKRKLTFQEHVDNGTRLKQAQALLMESQREMGKVLPKSARPLALISQTLDRLGLLRVELDTQVGIDCPEQSNEKLNHVYYGYRPKGRERLAVHAS